MKTMSVIGEGEDPFRVGLEIGEKLKVINPQIIIIFSSIVFEPFDEFIEGIESAFPANEVPIIVGGTGDGFYETHKVGEIGASAIGINGEEDLEFSVSFDDCTAEKENKKYHDVMKGLKVKMPHPSFGILLSDFRADGTQISGIFDEHFSCPFVGGLLGHGRIVESSYGFVNKNIMKNAFIIVGVRIKENSDFVFDIQSGSGWGEVGEAGIVTEVSGNTIISINNRNATAFLEEVTGSACQFIDKGIVAFRVTEKGGDKSYIRSIANIADSVSNEGVALYGHVKAGSSIIVCSGDPEVVKDEVSYICNRIKEKEINPELGVVISCTGRKWLLVKGIQSEVQDIFKVFDKKFPVIGFPSYGEFSPHIFNGQIVINGFHNMTYVILIVGKKK